MSSRAKIGILTLVTILLVLVTLTSVAVSSLLYVRDQAEDLIASVKSGSWQDAKLIVNDLGEELNSPFWATLTYVPVVGQEVSDYQKILSFGNDMLANNEVTSALDDVLTALDKDDVLAYDSVGALVHLADIVSEPLSELGKELHGQTKYTRLVQAAVPIVEEASAFSASPNSIYGGWLVIIMNNAEPKSLGGHPGVWAQIGISPLGLDVYEVRSVPDITSDVLDGFFNEEETKLLPATQSPWSDTPFELFDFPRCAQGCLQVLSYRKSNWVPTQGVVALDLWFVQDLVAALNNPNLILEDGTVINGNNLAQFLLADGYFHYENTEAQDAAYAQLPDAFLNNLKSGIDLSKAVIAVGDAIKNDDFYVWAKSESVREAVENAPAAGDVLAEAREGKMGIILCDRSASKVGWYASVTPQIRPWGANIRFQNNFDTSNGIPEQIEGDSVFVRYPGEFVVQVYLIAPPGVGIETIKSSDGMGFTNLVEQDGLEIWYGMISVSPGDDNYFEVFLDGEIDGFYSNLKNATYK